MTQTAERNEVQDGAESFKLPPRPGFNPLDYPVSTLIPKRIAVPSAWIGHVPFAMGLVEMVKPRVLVELGTQWGVSYSAFCQAVKTLRLDTRCYAVDTWQGCAHSGFFGSADLVDLKAHNDAEYAPFSELIQSTFDEALDRFPDGSIDVLHIDGFHSYDAVKHDYETWRPKVSDRGVILFHDTEIRWCETYGVWRLWDELKPQYPNFEFHHFYGLGVLAVGKTVPAGLQPLLNLPKPDADRIREYFTNLGDHLKEIAAKIHELQAVLHSNAQENARLAGELAATRQHYDQLRFRAVDSMAHRIQHFPHVYKALRSLARTAASVL